MDESISADARMEQQMHGWTECTALCLQHQEAQCAGTQGTESEQVY